MSLSSQLKKQSLLAAAHTCLLAADLPARRCTHKVCSSLVSSMKNELNKTFGIIWFTYEMRI
jgi:hypothetical protein